MNIIGLRRIDYDLFIKNKIISLFNTAQLSPCIKRKMAAIIFRPETFNVISEAYNTHFMDGPLCGGEVCTRIVHDYRRGLNSSEGCAHSETIALLHTARSSASTDGAHMLVIGEPCRMCASNIVIAGIEQVNIVSGGYPDFNRGIELLQDRGVKVSLFDMPSGFSTRPVIE